MIKWCGISNLCIPSSMEPMSLVGPWMKIRSINFCFKGILSPNKSNKAQTDCQRIRLRWRDFLYRLPSSFLNLKPAKVFIELLICQQKTLRKLSLNYLTLTRMGWLMKKTLLTLLKWVRRYHKLNMIFWKLSGIWKNRIPSQCLMHSRWVIERIRRDRLRKWKTLQLVISQ